MQYNTKNSKNLTSSLHAVNIFFSADQCSRIALTAPQKNELECGYQSILHIKKLEKPRRSAMLSGAFMFNQAA